VPQIRKVKKELFYKEAVFLNPPGNSTLQDLIRLSRTKHSDAHEREFDVSGNTLIWNNHTLRKDLDLGMLHSFEKGRSQLLLATSSAVKEYQVMETPPPAPRKKGEKFEFNEGLLFFAVHKNHVIVLQSASLKISKLTDYLNWLIRKAGHYTDANKVELQDPTPKNLRETGAPPLKSIRITSPFNVETEPAADASVSKKRQKKEDIKVKVGKKTWDPIRAFLESVGAKLPDHLNFDGNFNPSLVELSIELKWKGRKKDRDQTPVLDTILHSFQDVDDPPVEAVTATGSTIKGNDLRTRKEVFVDVQGKIPVYTNVYEHMQDYLAELLKSGDLVG